MFVSGARFFFDCSGGIRVGDFALIGGRDSRFWTHYFDAKARRIEPRRMTIGDGCYVCARATLIYCHLPLGTVVAAGAVVVGDFSGEGSGLLLAGNPAIVKRKR
jgi:acetyltransferase-like isoleucine patch superfamily enzyme